MKKIYNWSRCLTDWRVVKVSSNANNAENASAFYVNANNTASNNNVNIGSQLALNSDIGH